MTIIRSVTIGRAAGCDLRVDDEYASPRHCRIDQHANGTFTVEDLASTNGTWIRREGMRSLVKVRPGAGTELQQVALLRVGRTMIPWKESA